MNLVQIPALGCDHRLYFELDEQLPQTLQPQTIVVAADRMAGCVEQVLAAATPDFVIMGTSFGGRVAMEVALAAPTRVTGLIVIGAGPGPVVDQAGGLKRSQRVRGGELEQVLTEMGNIISHLSGPRGVQTMESFRSMGRAMGHERFALQSDALAYREDLWPRLNEIKCPVLCLWGEQDQFSGADVGRNLASVVPHGSFKSLKNCGHSPSLEYPQEAALAITSWARDAGLI